MDERAIRIKELEHSLRAMRDRPWATMPGDYDATERELYELRSDVAHDNTRIERREG